MGQYSCNRTVSLALSTWNASTHLHLILESQRSVVPLSLDLDRFTRERRPCQSRLVMKPLCNLISTCIGPKISRLTTRNVISRSNDTLDARERVTEIHPGGDEARSCWQSDSLISEDDQETEDRSSARRVSHEYDIGCWDGRVTSGRGRVDKEEVRGEDVEQHAGEGELRGKAIGWLQGRVSEGVYR